MSSDNITVRLIGQTTLIVVDDSIALDPEFVLKLMLDPNVASAVSKQMTLDQLDQLRELYESQFP